MRARGRGADKVSHSFSFPARVPLTSSPPPRNVMTMENTKKNIAEISRRKLGFTLFFPNSTTKIFFLLYT